MPGNNFERLIRIDGKIEFDHLTNGNNFEYVSVEHSRIDKTLIAMVMAMNDDGDDDGFDGNRLRMTNSRW